MYKGCFNLFYQLAKQHNMVIVSSILERDSVHQDKIYNTTGAYSNLYTYLKKFRLMPDFFSGLKKIIFLSLKKIQAST